VKRNRGPRIAAPTASLYPAPRVNFADESLPAFLICVEHGRLEGEAILLVESLRAWGGRCADSPVYAFAPRPDFKPEAFVGKDIDVLVGDDGDHPAEFSLDYRGGKLRVIRRSPMKGGLKIEPRPNPWTGL